MYHIVLGIQVQVLLYWVVSVFLNPPKSSLCAMDYIFLHCYKMLKFQKISFGLQIYERKLRTFDLSKKVLFVHFIQQKPPNNKF